MSNIVTRRSGTFWLVSAIVLMLCAGLIYIAFNWYELSEKDVYRGMQGEAITNPYLAMERTLEAMGATTTQVKNGVDWDAVMQPALSNAASIAPSSLLHLRGRNPLGSTLIMGDNRLPRMTVARVEQIRAWVREGGNLIVEAEQPTLSDPLLKSYGINRVGLRFTKRMTWVEKEKPADRETAADDESANETEANDAAENEDDDMPSTVAGIAAKLRDTKASTIEFADNTSFAVVFRPYQNLRIATGSQATSSKTKRAKLPEGALIVEDEIGTRLVQFQDGKGRVTVMTNFDFMTERALEKRDHAEFLWHVIATQNKLATASPSGVKAPNVILALRNSNPTLSQWLGQHAWMVLVAGLWLLAAWIARIVQRFGPQTPDVSTARLSLRDHLRAIGRYVARKGGWGSLAHAARERFMKRLLRERPGLSRMGGEDLFATLEKLSGVGHARIARALTAEVTEQRAFLEVIRTLKAIEQSLEHHRAAARAVTTKAVSKARAAAPTNPTVTETSST